jgi:hypothetical protein
MIMHDACMADGHLSWVRSITCHRLPVSFVIIAHVRGDDTHCDLCLWSFHRLARYQQIRNEQERVRRLRVM